VLRFAGSGRSAAFMPLHRAAIGNLQQWLKPCRAER
jgi:hypothetical protein